MIYKTKCNGHCTSRIDAQAETIHKLREESRKKTEALIKASKQIAQLQREKHVALAVPGEHTVHIPQEINRLNSIIERKDTELHRATERIISLKGDCNYYIDRTKQLKAEKMDLIRLLNQRSRAVNMRSDQNWDG